MLTRFFTTTLLILSLGISSFAAEPKGTFFIKLEADPTTLNAVTAVDVYGNEIAGAVHESLLTRDENTFAWIPNLAEKWEVSKDGTIFTFTLRDGVKWHDGKPLTVEDVKYSFDVYFEGRFQAPHMIPYLQNIKEVKIVDPKTVQFITKEFYFKNFDIAAGLTIIPKHFYGQGDPKDPKFNKALVGTGAYILDEWVKGQKITLKRNPDWWGNKVPYFQNRANFARLFYRLVKDESVAVEMLKKGDLDYIDWSRQPEYFATKTKGPEWGKKVIAVKAENARPQNYSYGYIGWNEKHPFFKDRDVRVAMSHLINREFMVEKFRYGLSEAAVGPFGNKSPASSPKVKPIPFDPKKAMELLNKAGWKMGPKGLTKTIDGQEKVFEFTILTANPDFEKYLTVMKEDMKKVGITMNIKLLEWNSFIKLVDERKFDAMNMGWQVNSLEPDPKQEFHSDAIPSPGHNFVSYSNPKVDELTEKLRKTVSENDRKGIYHQIHELLAADQPYSFLFNNKYSLYGHTARIKKPQDTMKYSIGESTWSVAE